MDDAVAKIYGNKVRVRACGLLWEGTSLLMVNHKGITPTNFWAPPGGGVEFGVSVAETLKKEFKEETGLSIKPGNFLFGCEYINKPIHSIELFYEVEREGGNLKTGTDPEIQIIKAVEFKQFVAIRAMPQDELHGIFRFTPAIDDLKRLKGFYPI